MVVDPRRTETAEHADERVPIRPGSDAHLLVAMAQVLFAEGLVDLGELAPDTSGARRAAGRGRALHPRGGRPGHRHRRRPPSGVWPASSAAAPTAAVYGRIGTHTAAFGSIAAWAVDVLNVLHRQPRSARRRHVLHARPTTATPGQRQGPRLRHRPPAQPGAAAIPRCGASCRWSALAEEIETPGDGQVRALVTVAGNPVLSAPELGGVDRPPSATLDFMVSVDPYRNETTRHADVILPPPSPLERSEYHLAFFTLAVHNFAEWSPPLFAAPGPQEHEILGRLALIATGPDAGDDPAAIDELILEGALGAAIGAPGSPVADRTVAELLDIVTADPVRSTADHLVDVMIRTGPYGDWFGAVPDGISLDTLAAQPHGVDLGPLVPRLPSVLRTPSGTVELAPPPLLADLDRLAASLEGPLADPDGLVLIGRRQLRSNNSWMHNVDVLAKGRFRCTLLVHPDDAARLGLTDGASAEVRSRVGAVVAPVEVTDAVSPGVVSLPHGWGHDLPGCAVHGGRRARRA